MTSCVARSNLIALWIFAEEEEVSSPLAVEEVEEVEEVFSPLAVEEVEEVFSPLAVEEVEEVFSPLAVEEVSSLSRQERENEDLAEERNLLAAAMPMIHCHPHHPKMAAHPA
jgi:hypothetical protein